jgi:hypothetical protein
VAAGSHRRLQLRHQAAPPELDRTTCSTATSAAIDTLARRCWSPVWQDLDPVAFLWDFRDRIYHVDCKESVKQFNGRNGRLGSHLPWGDPRRGWDFVSTGHGDVPWEACFRMLNAIGYDGPISVEWEDAGMDRLIGGPDALAFIREMVKIAPSAASFDSAFSSSS